MKTKEQIEAKIAKLQLQLEKLNKPVDGWRVYKEDSTWMFYLKDGKYLFGINSVGNWITDFGLDYEPTEDSLATDEEVKQRLTKLVNGMGYKEGVTVMSLIINGEVQIKSNDFKFGITSDGIYYIQLDGFFIWTSEKGWAKIVEKPKFEVEAGYGPDFGHKNWSKENGAKFYLTIKNKSMSHSDFTNFSITEIANLLLKIETILNSEK